MLVSICITTHNAEQSIRTTLESVKNQTYTDFEVIIVDDHSTDSTIRIIYNEFCARDSRFKLYVNCTSKSYVDAHNLSYEYAKGEYLFRISSNDILYPDYLQTHIDFLNNHPEIDALSTDMLTYSIENGLSNLIEQDEKCKAGNSFSEVSWFNENAAHSMLGNTVIWSDSSSSLRRCFYEKYHPKYITYSLGDRLFWWNVLSYGAKLHKLQEVKSAKCIYNNQSLVDSAFWDLPYWASAVLAGYKEQAFKLQHNTELEEKFKQERLHFENLSIER